MAQQTNIEDYINSIVTDISVKLRDMEEKQNMLKDRVILIGENLVSEKDSIEEEILNIKKSFVEMESEMKKLRLAIERIIDDTENFARKNELETLKKQFQMFQPLELARISDVEDIVKRMLKSESAESKSSAKESRIRMSGLG